MKNAFTGPLDQFFRLIGVEMFSLRKEMIDGGPLEFALQFVKIAQPFQLDHGYAHAWRADQPPVTAGYLVALRAEAELLPPM
ncbi:MAG: hypothetical protein AAF585_09865, partial [Verrucomicrobiota bacterium]